MQDVANRVSLPSFYFIRTFLPNLTVCNKMMEESL
jgi:hypothetical protein